MGRHGVWPIYVIILLTCLAKCSISLPINDQVPEESRPWLNNLTEYDTARYAGRTLKAIELDPCEFGDTLATYDETCPNGATGILPCNPGQLKVVECIGQDGDTSRMCDPCPQKFYQSFYNRCTACHRCSECGPNQQIRQPCTDETDTACESIIPPDPVPTTTPTPTADAPVPSLSTQNIDESTPRVPDATTAASTPQTTRKGPFYTEGPVLTITTTQNVSVLEPGTSVNRGTSQIATCIAIWVIAGISVGGNMILIFLLGITCRTLKKERMRNNELTQRLTSQSNSSPVPIVSGSNSGLEPERPLGDHEGPPAAEGSIPNVVVDCPDDERVDLLSRGLHSLLALLPHNVVKDSGRKKKDVKRKKQSQVSFHKNTSGHSGKKTSVAFESLQPGDRTKFQKDEGTGEGRHLRDEDFLHDPETPLPGNRRASDDRHPENENIPPSTITTADVHNLEDLQRARESGDGESLQMGDVVRDGHVSPSGDSHDPNLGDQDDPRNHHGQDNDPSHQSPTDDLHWHAEKVPGSFSSPSSTTGGNVSSTNVTPDEHWYAEKVPGSFALPSSTTDGNVSSTNVTPLDNDEHWYAEKVPGSFASTSSTTDGNVSSTNVTPLDNDEHWYAEKVPGSFASPSSRRNRNMSSTDTPSLNNDKHGHAEKVPVASQETGVIGPDVVTDTPSDNTTLGDQEDNPQTLRSSAPMADQEEWLEEQEVTEANNELDKNTPTAETNVDVLQRLTEPEATVDNINDGNATPAAEDTPVSDNGIWKLLKWRPSPFFKKQRRKSHDNQPVQQTQPLLRNMDQMVDENCVQYVADKLKLAKLDRLCRELGLKETEVENYKYELKSRHYTGSELVFKILVKIRELQGIAFTYGRLDTALRKSHNAHVADDMVRNFLR